MRALQAGSARPCIHVPNSFLSSFSLLPCLRHLLEPCAQTDAALATGSSPQSDEPILAVEAGLHSNSLRAWRRCKNRFLVTGSIDKTVRVWDLPTGKLLGILRPPIGKRSEGMILAVDVSPDGDTIACGGRTRESEKSGRFYLFDRESRRMLKRIPGFPSLSPSCDSRGTGASWPSASGAAADCGSSRLPAKATRSMLHRPVRCQRWAVRPRCGLRPCRPARGFVLRRGIETLQQRTHADREADPVEGRSALGRSVFTGRLPDRPGVF